MSCAVFVPTDNPHPMIREICADCGDWDNMHPECPACWMAPSDHEYEQCPEYVSA